MRKPSLLELSLSLCLCVVCVCFSESMIYFSMLTIRENNIWILSKEKVHGLHLVFYLEGKGGKEKEGGEGKEGKKEGKDFGSLASERYMHN